jgi:hypothetical protein
VPSVNEMMAPLVAKPVRAPSGHYLNQTPGPVIMLKPLAANDNHRFDATALEAA